MPLYEFVCSGCEEKTEFMLPMEKRDSKRKCPVCGKLKLKRVLFSSVKYHDILSPMHPRRGRGVGGFGRIEPGDGGIGLDPNAGQ